MLAATPAAPKDISSHKIYRLIGQAEEIKKAHERLFKKSMSTSLQNLRIALVHDWLLGVGGAEKTLKALHETFPQAPVYTLFYNKKFTDWFLPQVDIRTTFAQKFYSVLRSHKLLTPILPIAIESVDLSDFDLVISSSVAFAKGLVLKPQTKHICYCYSPTRQLWDWHTEYMREGHIAPKFWVRIIQHLLRIWDRHASTRVDEFIAISENVRKRIKKYYQRDSTVIYPPVTFSKTTNYQLPTTNYFLIVSRLFKHKNIDIAVKAFNKLEWPLVIIGDGPEYKNLKSQIAPASPRLGRGRANLKNIKMLGFIPDEKLPYYYQNCAAFIMPQEEDFGITPIEAMNYGKPVLALKRGGALEYIQEGINGEFFEDPTEEVLADGVRRLKENLSHYNPEIIKKTAERFSEERFKKEIKEYICKLLQSA